MIQLWKQLFFNIQMHNITGSATPVLLIQEYNMIYAVISAAQSNLFFFK